MTVPIGFVTQTGMSPEEVFQQAAEHEFAHVELLMEGNNDRSRFNPNTVKQVATEHGVNVHVHLPWYLDISSPKEHVREGSIREVEEAIEVAAEAGAGKAVLHAGTRAWMAAWDPEDIKPQLLTSIRRLDDVARENSVELCIENLPSGFYTLREDFPTLLSETDSSVCLDTGHALREGWDEAAVGAFISDPANRVSHIHLADPRADGAVHLPLGAGSTDFEALLTPVGESDWSGTVSVEVFTTNFDYLAASKRHVEALF